MRESYSIVFLRVICSLNTTTSSCTHFPEVSLTFLWSLDVGPLVTLLKFISMNECLQAADRLRKWSETPSSETTGQAAYLESSSVGDSMRHKY